MIGNGSFEDYLKFYEHNVSDSIDEDGMHDVVNVYTEEMNDEG